MFEHSNKNDNCIGFNTLGYFKNEINLNELVKNKFISKNGHGIYIKINKLSGSNKFLKIDNINTLDKEYNYDGNINNGNINIDELSKYCDKNNFNGFTSNGFLKKSVDLCDVKNIIELNQLYNSSLYVNIHHYISEAKKFKKYIRIKILSNIKSFNKLTMGNMLWDNIEFTNGDNLIDYYIIINEPSDNNYFLPSKTIVFYTKPNYKYNNENSWFSKLVNKNDGKDFLQVRNYEQFLAPFIWNIDKSYFELKNKSIEKKYNKILIDNDINDSIISSLLSNGLSLETNTGLDNQSDYKFSIIIDNDEEKVSNNISQKLLNSIVCESLTFYSTKKNISGHINPESFILIDIENIDDTVTIIKNALKDNSFERRFEIIKQEKNKILDNYNLMPMIYNIINNRF